MPAVAALILAIACALGFALGCEGAPSSLAGVDAADAIYDAIPPPEPCANIVEPAWPPDDPLPPEFDFPPWLTIPAPGVVTVSWRSATETTGFVLYGKSPRLTDVGVSLQPAYTHHVKLDALPPATPIWYEVLISGTGASRKGVFVTPGRDTWRFMHIAEFHAPTNSDDVEQFTDAIRRFHPHVLLESGDMVDTGSNMSHWRSYMKASSGWISNVILLPAHSNHVNGVQGNSIHKELFDLPNNERWYATRYSQVQFISMDSTYDGSNSDILSVEPLWAADQMQAATDGSDDPAFTIAAWHYPVCSSKYRSRAASRKWVTENFVDALVDNGELDMIMVGHDKYYERSLIDDRIIHVMTNTGKLAPSVEGDNNPRCTPMVTNANGRSLVLATVGGGLLAARVIDGDGTEVEAVAIDKRAAKGVPVCVAPDLFDAERAE